MLATGTIEQPVIFANNDRPGIMLSSAVRRLIASRRPLRAVLVDEVQHAALADDLTGVDVPVYLGSRPLIEATLGYAFHRGGRCPSVHRPSGARSRAPN